MTNVIIAGAAGRDFHNFNMCYREERTARVVAFTAAQIAGISGRRYPPALAGSLYPNGIPIVEESELEQICRREQVGLVVFAYSDVAHTTVMHSWTGSSQAVHRTDRRSFGPRGSKCSMGGSIGRRRTRCAGAPSDGDVCEDIARVILQRRSLNVPDHGLACSREFGSPAAAQLPLLGLQVRCWV